MWWKNNGKLAAPMWGHYHVHSVSSSLFLSFFFAPTFALPWLSFLPSQVEILLTLFLMNLNYTTWLIGNYYKLLILIVETVEPNNMNQPVEGSQYCIEEGWPMTARWAPFRQRILKMRNVRVPESGNETVLTTHQINKVPAPQVQPLVDFWGNLGNRKPRSLWWFGDIWGIFWPVSISFRFPRVAISCHQGHSTRRESGFWAQRSPLLLAAVLPWQRRHRRDSFVGVSFGLEAGSRSWGQENSLEIPWRCLGDTSTMFFTIRYHNYIQLCRHNSP